MEKTTSLYQKDFIPSLVRRLASEGFTLSSLLIILSGVIAWNINLFERVSYMIGWDWPPERMSKLRVLLFEREGAFGNQNPLFWKRENHVSGEICLKSRSDLTATAVYKWATEVKSKGRSTFLPFTRFLNRATVHLLQHFNGGKDPFLNTSPIFVFFATIAMGPKKKMASKSKIAEAQGASSARTSGDDQIPAPSSLVSSTNGKIEPLEVGLIDLTSLTLDWRSVFKLKR